jgi:trehalose 6-phosphate synthase/phosphatase
MAGTYRPTGGQAGPLRGSKRAAANGRKSRATKSSGRVILVSNRLPISVRVEHGELVVGRSSGGLATGLSGYHDRGESVWIGWPGETWRLTPDQRKTLSTSLAAMHAFPVDLSAAEVQRYYDGFSNGVLWPLLHYQMDKLPLNAEGWETYERVNQRFADVVVDQYRPGDLIWVHDYQLALVPGMIRAQLPDAAIGFFLHVPFPSGEVFRLLPWRRQILEGMLGASLIGFHTVSYVLHFLTSAANVLGAETGPGRVSLAGRAIRVGTFPMGIDAAAYEAQGNQPSVVAEAKRLRQAAGGAALIVSVDRLDYTKGIPRRLLSFERLLEKYPRLRGRVRLVQVAAPSRGSVSQYREFQRTVNEMVGRINGRFATPGYDPIHYISQNLDSERLTAFYRAATIALVTPLRDGMNLVAKEFVASRGDGDGVLVLSEFAGAAAELTDALIVNPYDLDSVAATIHDALEMPEAERRARMAGMRDQVKTHDVHLWARRFVAALRIEARRQARNPNTDLAHANSPSEVAAAILADVGRPLLILLDYDGTLVGLRPSPDEASPDTEILRILATLALLPGVEVDVVSGRRRNDIEMWLGSLPVGIHAEHGLWSRGARQETWIRRDVNPAWLETARAAMTARAGLVPGSFVEEKDASVVWHYRNVGAGTGRREAESLTRELNSALADSTATIMQGSRVVEVKDQSTDKGIVVRELAATAPGARMLVIGDDITDEDMFRSAPDDAVTVRVGSGRTAARMRLIGPDQVRKLLTELIEQLDLRIHPDHAVPIGVGSQAEAGDPAETTEPTEPTDSEAVEATPRRPETGS